MKMFFARCYGKVSFNSYEEDVYFSTVRPGFFILKLAAMLVGTPCLIFEFMKIRERGIFALISERTILRKFLFKYKYNL